jgi:tRNA (guanine37-N1)-methyltransferase
VHLRKRLKGKLTNALSADGLRKVYSAFDIVGDIAIIKTSLLNPEEAKVTANQILAIHKNIKSVYTQSGAIKSCYRNRELELLVGKEGTTASHKESGCIFKVDIAKCYFSPRLAHERARIAYLVRGGEVVVNMFAGVGCFSIIIAKTVPQVKVYSIDVNPTAVEFMVENVRVNRVYGKVQPLPGDAKTVIESKLRGIADRVLMPLPELAIQYLPAALMTLKPSGGWIHFHYFIHATPTEDPIEKTKQQAASKLDSLGVKYIFDYGRIVRSTGPNWWHIVLDVKVAGVPSKF